MLCVRVYTCRPEENHLRGCSGNLLFFFLRSGSLIGLDWTRVPGPVSSRDLPVTASPELVYRSASSDLLYFFCFESEFLNAGPCAY